jgi:hypothetical protein
MRKKRHTRIANGATQRDHEEVRSGAIGLRGSCGGKQDAGWQWKRNGRRGHECARPPPFEDSQECRPPPVGKLAVEISLTCPACQPEREIRARARTRRSCRNGIASIQRGGLGRESHTECRQLSPGPCAGRSDNQRKWNRTDLMNSTTRGRPAQVRLRARSAVRNLPNDRSQLENGLPHPFEPSTATNTRIGFPWTTTSRSS